MAPPLAGGGSLAAGAASLFCSMRSILADSRSLLDEVGLRLARHIGFNLRLHLLEVRRLALALVLDLDDMPAELALHRIGNLACLEFERDLRELRHHLLLGEVAKVAAIRGARILRLLLGEFGEIAALLQLLDDLLGFILGLDQDMPCADFLVAAHLRRGVVIDLAHCRIGGRGLGLVGQQLVHQQPVTREGEALLEGVAVTELLVLGGLGDDLQVDDVGQQVFTFGRRVHLRKLARAEFLFRHVEVALADFRAVDLGEHRIGVLRANLGGACEDNCCAAGDRQGGDCSAERRGRAPKGSGHENLSDRGCFRPADSRPIAVSKQCTKSGKIMNFPRGYAPLTRLWAAHISARPDGTGHGAISAAFVPSAPELRPDRLSRTKFQ